MPIPFIAGAIIGAAAVIAYNKKGACVKEKLSNFDGDSFAKKAGEFTENLILKTKNLASCGCEGEKKTTRAKKTAGK